MKAVWVVSSFLPVAGRQIGEVGGGKLWLDLCNIGVHIPQMYRPEEITALIADDCEGLGLCPACLGFGTTDEVSLIGAGPDQVPNPCPGCGGTGRPFIRLHITRTPAATESWIEILPHRYVTPLPGSYPDACLACGSAKDDEHHLT